MIQPHNHGTWTVLPALPLIDADGPNVESALSYFLRVAHVCRLPATRLLKLIDTSSGNIPVWNAKVRSGLNGPGELFLRRLETLERLTGQSIAAGTFASLNSFLSPRSSGFTGIRRTWCPRCLMLSDPAEQPSDRLIWNLLHYSKCAIHGVDIVCSCRHCGEVQPYGRGLTVGFLCTFCKGPLGHEGRLSVETPFSKWTNSVIEELVSWCVTEANPGLDAENYRIFIEMIRSDRKFDQLKSKRPPTSPSLSF